MRYSIAICGALAAFTLTAPAVAANFIPGDEEFIVGGGDPTTGTDVVTANIGRSGLAQGSGFSDSYLFRIGPITGAPIGSGQGTVQTLASISGLATDTNLTSVTFSNGVDALITLTLGNGISHIINGIYQFDIASVGGIPIYSGILNSLTINYDVPTGNGAYSGTLSFLPNAVPEPGTWALFLAGFAVLGFALRRKPSQNVRVRYSF